MKTKDMQRFPLIGDVNEGGCPYIMATCSTCMYRQCPDDAWKTNDYRDRCLYKEKAGHR